MSRAPAMRVSLALIPVVLLAARPARAQSAEQAGIQPIALDLGPLERELAVIGAALSLVPAAVGVDAPAGPRDIVGPRLTIDWPMQFPLRTRARGTALRHGPVATHRIVLTPGIALAFEPSVLAFLRIRAGYRAVVHPHRSSLGVVLGVGHTVEVWSDARVSLSPEFGVHVGPCCEPFFPDGFVIVRADVWLSGIEAARLSAQIGWSFY